MTTTTKRKVMDEGFSDTSVRGGLRDRPESYSGKTGRRDVIRVLTIPISYYGARVQFRNDANKGFFALSHADHDTVLAGDMETAKKQCPLVRHNLKLQRRFAVMILWVSSTQNGRTKTVNQIMPWAFAGEQYTALRNIESTLTPFKLKSGGTKPRNILDVELAIETTDETFQKKNFAAIQAPSTGKRSEVMAMVSEYFTDGLVDADHCPILDEFLEPEGLAELEQSLARAFGSSGDVEGDDVDTEPAAPKGKAKPAVTGGKKPAAAPATTEEADDLDDLLGEGDEGGETEEAAPAPKAAVKPVAAAKPAPKVNTPTAVSKPTAKPAAAAVTKPAAKPVKPAPAPAAADDDEVIDDEVVDE